MVGFCGGPFTVAGYLVEGKPSRDFAVTKTLMYREPAVWHGLLEKLADTFAAYTLAQAAAGADAVQLFDSWVGALSPADYAEFAAPSSARVLSALREAGVPSIHFGTGAVALLPAMAAAGGDVIGLDWRVPLDEGWGLAGEDRGVQGNLDPTMLLGPWERVEAVAPTCLPRVGRPGHIFNLGHGVLPATHPDVLGRLREFVHARRRHEAMKLERALRIVVAVVADAPGPSPCSSPTTTESSSSRPRWTARRPTPA